MDLAEKLEILADSAKYDVACTSSGVDRPGQHGSLGSCAAAGICHAFTPDGRCVSLLKVLYSNACSYDCRYCVNRRSNDRPRATFTPRELAELTIGFYRRNYIEGLFLSSAVLGTPDRTMELMIESLRILRQEYHFNGYIHAKTIPGADPLLIERIGLLADRLSVNIEFPSENSLRQLAPDKKKAAILRPMRQIAVKSAQSKRELTVYKKAPAFAPAGQSTQMIIGATPETDRHIMELTEGLYKKYALKRVFYSAYLPIVADERLPALSTRPPLLREHRLYQADWLLIPTWTPNVPGRYVTRSFSPWRSIPPAGPNCCGCQASGRKVRCASCRHGGCKAWAWRNSNASGWCSNGPSISSPATVTAPRVVPGPRLPVRCWTPRPSVWVSSSLAWMILPPNRCPQRPLRSTN